MAFQKFIKQGHAPGNIIRRRMNLAEVVLFLLDSCFEVHASHGITIEEE